MERYGAIRSRLLNSHDELGLILFNLGSSMKLSDIFSFFVSLLLEEPIYYLLRRLRTNEKEKTHWPSSIKEKEYLADPFCRRETKVEDEIRFTDEVS